MDQKTEGRKEWLKEYDQVVKYVELTKENELLREKVEERTATLKGLCSPLEESVGELRLLAEELFAASGESRRVLKVFSCLLEVLGRVRGSFGEPVEVSVEPEKVSDSLFWL